MIALRELPEKPVKILCFRYERVSEQAASAHF